jgi:hypothetical protein
MGIGIRRSRRRGIKLMMFNCHLGMSNSRIYRKVIRKMIKWTIYQVRNRMNNKMMMMIVEKLNKAKVNNL